MNSLRGHLLAASPSLDDDHFERAVILVLEHHERGAVGVVLNRPANSNMQELLEKLSHAAIGPDTWVGMGGPLPGPVVTIHKSLQTNELELQPGLHMATEPERLNRIFQDEESCRVFIGHAQWDEGELEGEVAAGAWMVLPASPDNIFADSDELWETVIRQVGERLLWETLGVDITLGDPRMN